MKVNELIEKLDSLCIDADNLYNDTAYLLDELSGIEGQLEHNRDTADELRDNIMEVVGDIKANPIGDNAYIDQDELEALLEWKDLVDDFIHKIVNHRGASINRKVEKDEDNQ